MKRVLFLCAALTATLLIGCQSPAGLSDSKSEAALRAASSAGIRSVNWGDSRDNYNAGWVLPSGVSASQSYNTILANAKTIANEFKSKIGANTVRVPINPPTVAEWWGTYKAVIDAPLAQGMKVIIACWTESNTVGKVTDSTKFYNMWTTVVNAYKGNSNVYFEILNEPFGYSKDAWLNEAATWLSKFSSVPRARVLVGGTGYSDNVAAVGGDSRVSGCLFSQHIYGFWKSYTTNGAWYNEISGRVGAYSGSTVITEFGANMTTGLNFYGTASTNNEICFMQGVTNYARDKNMGSSYWPGLRDGDTYSLTGRVNGGYTLSVNNTSGVNQVRWGWGL